MGFDEPAICVRARSSPRSRHQILWTFFCSFSDDARIFTCWARIDLRWNRVWQIVCFSSISHACQPATAGGIHLKFTLVVVGRAYEYSLQWVNAWTHFFSLFVLLCCCVSVANRLCVFSVLCSRLPMVLENWFDTLVVWLFLIANEFGFLSCQYSKRFKPIFIA